MNIFKFLLIGLLFCSTGQAATDAELTLDIYASDEPDSAGAKIVISGGPDWRWRSEIVVSNNLAGVGVALGYKWQNEFQFYLGLNKVHKYDPVDAPNVGTPPIHQVYVSEGKGHSWSAELDYKWIFVRYNRYYLEHDFSILSGTLPARTDSGTIDNNGSVYWLGVRIPLQ